MEIAESQGKGSQNVFASNLSKKTKLVAHGQNKSTNLNYQITIKTDDLALQDQKLMKSFR